MTATRNRAQKQSCEWRRRPDHRAFLCAKVGEKYSEYLFTKRRVARRRCARKRRSYRDSCSRVFQLLFGKRGVTISTTRTIYACCPVDRCFASCRLSTVYRSVDRWLIIASPRDEIYYESKRHFVNM